MIDKTRNEAASIEHAGRMVGEFIEERMREGLGSDFAKWPPEVYFGMVEVGVTAFVENMQTLVCSGAEMVPDWAHKMVKEGVPF